MYDLVNLVVKLFNINFSFSSIIRRKRVIIVIVVLIFSTTIYFIQDYLAPYYHRPSYLDADVEYLVIDVNGYLKNYIDDLRLSNNTIYVEGLNVNDFRVLGSAKAETIVIVSHGLILESGKRREYALETSEDDTLVNAVKHPILILSKSIAKGYIPSFGKKIAVTQNIFKYSRLYNNKTIILITCGIPETETFAKEFLSHGASHVFYIDKTISINEVIDVLNKLFEAEEHPSLQDILVTKGFKVLSKK